MSVFAFIDILGFKNNVKNDPASAATMLSDLSTVLTNSTSSLVNFEEFFSGSDSIFITASNISALSKGLAEFLNECFTFYALGHQYPINLASPTEVEISDIKFEDGHVVNSHISTFWPPLLFRGGISSQQTLLIKVENIENKKIIRQRNILGAGVIDAINTEGLGFSGPRIFLSNKFNLALLNGNINNLIHPSFDQPNYFELYWPIVTVHTTNNLNLVLINEFKSMMDIAVNLWNATNHLNFGHHYYSLIKLIVQSFKLALIPVHGDPLVTASIVRELQNYPSLSLKINDLVA